MYVSYSAIKKGQVSKEEISMMTAVRPTDQLGLITGEWSILGGRSRGNKATVRLSHIFENLRRKY